MRWVLFNFFWNIYGKFKNRYVVDIRIYRYDMKERDLNCKFRFMRYLYREELWFFK